MAYGRRIAALCGALTLIAGSGGLAQVPNGAGEWRYYNADAGGSKYSPLDAIDKSNVARLGVAWRHVALDPELRQSVRGLTASNYYRVTPGPRPTRPAVSNRVRKELSGTTAVRSLGRWSTSPRQRPD